MWAGSLVQPLYSLNETIFSYYPKYVNGTLVLYLGLHLGAIATDLGTDEVEVLAVPICFEQSEDERLASAKPPAEVWTADVSEAARSIPCLPPPAQSQVDVLRDVIFEKTDAALDALTIINRYFEQLKKAKTPVVETLEVAQ